MKWNEEKDLLLTREMAARGIFQNKAGSRERGNIWQEIATNLNNYEEFVVTLRGVRDRFSVIMKSYKAKTRKEVQGTGLAGEELTEYEMILEDLIERFEESDRNTEEESDKKRAKGKDDKEKAQDIRNKAMETFGDTRKRKELMEGGNEPKDKKCKRSSSDRYDIIYERKDGDG